MAARSRQQNKMKETKCRQCKFPLVVRYLHHDGNLCADCQAENQRQKVRARYHAQKAGTVPPRQPKVHRPAPVITSLFLPKVRPANDAAFVDWLRGAA